MDINVIDASNYFKGLLLLIRKDRQLSEPETELMRRVGKALGFEKEFCEHAVRDILENEFIEDVAPEFSTKELAMKFIRDGLTLANVYDGIHLLEEEWLRSTAQKNSLDLHWFLEEKKKTKNTRNLHVHLEVDDLTVIYS